jgi:succinate dehydrogenase hydrophobic anchor subunit
MANRKDGSSQWQVFRMRAAVLSLILVLMLCAMLHSPAAAADAVNLKINQIVQQDGQFALYVSALDQGNLPVALNDPPENFEVQADALQPFKPISAAPFSRSGEGVSYIIAVDVSGSVTKQEVKDIKQALHGFVAGLGGDFVKLITVGSEINVVADYSNDRSALDAVIDSKISRDDPKTYLYQGLIRAMDSAAAQMLNGPKRTVMIVFTDGGDDSDGVWTADDVIVRMDAMRLPVYAVALKGNAKMNPSAVNRLCEDTGGALYKEEDFTVAGALDKIRSAILNATVLTVAPSDPAYFGVKDSQWSVSLQAGGREVSSKAFVITTKPTAPPARVPLTFHDAGLAKAIKAALGKAEGADLYEEDRSAIESLTSLDAHGMGVADLQDLAMMPKLTEIRLNDNSVTDISILKQFSQLSAISLDGNGLKDISPLKYLDSLKMLSAKDNSLADITFVRNLDNLEQLDLSENKIEDVSPLRYLSKLTSLNLADNRISKAQPLAGLASLTALDLHGNPLSDQESLRSLSDAGCLLVLDTPLATPTPKPTVAPTPAPTPAPAPSAGQLALKWALSNWLYLALGAIALLALIIVLAVVRGRKNPPVESIDVDFSSFGRMGGAEEKTLPMDNFNMGDPDKTIPLGSPGNRTIRFLIESGGRTKETARPIKKTLTIGRAPDCDLVLEDKHVSRKHAALNLKYDALYIQDLGSVSGTQLNGSPIVRETTIRKADIVKLGETTLKIIDISN